MAQHIITLTVHHFVQHIRSFKLSLNIPSYLAVAVVYLHDITTYINIREISQMNHANKDLKEVKNLLIEDHTYKFI